MMEDWAWPPMMDRLAGWSESLTRPAANRPDSDDIGLAPFHRRPAIEETGEGLIYGSWEVEAAVDLGTLWSRDTGVESGLIGPSRLVLGGQRHVARFATDTPACGKLTLGNGDLSIGAPGRHPECNNAHRRDSRQSRIGPHVNSAPDR